MFVLYCNLRIGANHRIPEAGDAQMAGPITMKPLEAKQQRNIGQFMTQEGQ